MIRLTEETPLHVLNELKQGDLVTDTFSKTGLIATVTMTDDGLYRIYEVTLVTGRVITIKK